MHRRRVLVVVRHGPSCLQLDPRRKSVAEKVRYNKIIDLLEHGKPAFSTSTVPNGSWMT